MIGKEIDSKKQRLIDILRKCNSILVAFSGGVDSTFLLAIAHEVLKDNVIAATADSITFPRRELNEAKKFTQKRGIKHLVFKSREAGLPEFISNNPDRCYFCKKHMCETLFKIAGEHGMEHVAHAVNMDDLKDYRPGLKAAEEAGIIAPLVMAEIGKDDIRSLSREMGLASWDKPSMACLASRIPYGEVITEKKLKMIEQSEEFLFDKGFRQCRVRIHGDVARIETDSKDLDRFMDMHLRIEIVEAFRKIGFNHISVDLEGYRSGSMNRSLHIDRNH